MGKQVMWTKRQRELIEEIIKAQNDGYKHPLRHASDVIRVQYNTARNTLYRIRNKHEAMREALEDYANWRRKLKGRRYL